MDKSNLQKIIEFSQAHIDKTLYSYLFMLFKYIFLGEEGISDKTNNGVTKSVLEKSMVISSSSEDSTCAMICTTGPNPSRSLSSLILIRLFNITFYQLDFITGIIFLLKGLGL
jgi:hypothetical protein